MLAHIPLWVFAVFFLLLALGLRQARTRPWDPRRATALALFWVAFSLWGVVSAFGADPVTMLCWLLGAGLTLWMGRAWLAPRAMVVADDGKRVQVPGSWLPMALMLAIFGVKFALGYEAAVGAPITAQSAAGAMVAIGLGLASGAFLARALAVRRFALRAG